MGFIETLEKIEDWLEKAGGEKVEMSEWDYADENTREYWEMLYKSNPNAFSQAQIDIIEDAFLYNASVETLENGESAQPRIRTVNLMHSRFKPNVLLAMSEAMKIGVNLKTCAIQPNRWREEVLDTLMSGFHKNINVIENSNNYINPELLGIIDGMEKDINLMRYITKHQYSDAITGDRAYELIQSGKIPEKQCLKHAEYLNKGNFYDTYELINLKRYIMLGGNPNEFIDKFCRNQHVYHMQFLRDGKLITNEPAVKNKNDKMIEFIKKYGIKKIEEKKVKDNMLSVHSPVQVPELAKVKNVEQQHKLSKREYEFLKPDYVEKDNDELESDDLEAEILSYYNRD